MSGSTSALIERAPAPEPDDLGRPPRRRPLARTLLVGLLGLGVGVAGAVCWSALRSTDGDGGGAGGAVAAPAADVTPIDEAALRGDAGPSIAGSPAEAVGEFLRAEQEGDYPRSFTYLSAADRAAFGTVAGWIARHADVVPPVVRFELGAVAPSAGDRARATVETMVEFEPALDEFVGLVPGRAAVTWTVAEDGGGWGVELESRVIEPVLPPEGEAAAAVSRWADSRRRCGTEGQWAGQPLAFPGLADDLCGAGGVVDVGDVDDVTPLSPLDATPFVAAFGGDVLTSLRVVPVSGPVAFRAVVAPVGAAWLVVGVLPA